MLLNKKGTQKNKKPAIYKPGQLKYCQDIFLKGKSKWPTQKVSEIIIPVVQDY